MYNDKVMELFRNPHNAGALRGADAVGTAGNITCGDIIKIYMAINKNEVITNATFKTFGCVSAIAASSITCDLIKGKTLDQALKLTNKDVIDALGGLPTQKIHCSVLAKEAIEDGIKRYRKKLAKLAKRK
jgi:NifU-like protein involved in Fe-S cluster formation